VVVQCVGLSCSLPTIAFLSDSVGGGQYGSLIQFTSAKLFCQRRQMLKALARKFSEAQRTLIIFPMASTVFLYMAPLHSLKHQNSLKKKKTTEEKNPEFFFSFLLLRKGYHQKRFTKRKNSECLIIRTAS
jgi:hypothetical protein